ncbi:glycosyltransferase [Rufibacter latericius]|uniref:Glycosyltransferase n=1 Tax=Rufibacter latericius TaxID=2487040 RepID=A0A3M9MUP7_9BACT|nr:glycosyltransferase [Rufibacter latericius]RNI29234.1 glycosyltransferase [Rufibacter latericius]
MFSKVEFTGERFIPSSELLNDEIGVEHLHRYYTVLDQVTDKIVLDIACGEGYGSNILAKKAKKVFGVDIDPTSVEYAQSTYESKLQNLSFLQGSVEKIPLADSSVDIVISFETIEHVDEATQNAFLKEVKRVLKEGGRLIISTPDRVNYSERYSYKNEFHVKEFSSDEFHQFLASYFKNVETFNQGFEIVSAITAPNSSASRSIKVCDWKKTPISPSRKYLISVCSDTPAQEASDITSVVFHVNKNYLDVTDKITHNEAHILELGAWGKSLDEEVLEKNTYIHSLQDELSIQSEAVKNLKSERLQMEVSFQEKELLFQKTLQDLLALKEENTRHEQKIAQLSAELSDNQQTVQGLKQKIHSQYQEIDALSGRLQEIYVSEGWKLLSVYYHLKGKALPENSNRYRVLKKAINSIRGKKEDEVITLSPRVGQKVGGLQKEPIKKITYTPFELPLFENPLVSIIIPAYNAWEMNYQCIHSIKENSLGVSYEVILADDGSTDETKNIENYIRNIKPIRSGKNLGFLQNCNNAATFAKGKYVLFLNNDTEVQPGWLIALTDLMEKDASIGMAGSKLIYPDGRLQEAGGIIWNDASGWNFGHRQDPDLPQFNYVKEVDYVSGASIIIRKSLWDELGGFDERYIPAYCEDSDIAFAIREKGYKVIYQPLSEVIHYEGYSHGNDREQSAISSIKEYQKINNQKFFEKWKTVLQRDQFPNAENVFWARERSGQKKTVLMIDHYVPQYDKDAGSRTTFGYLELLVSLGYNVKFLGDNFYKHEPYTSVLQQMGVEVLYGLWWHENWQQWFLENSDKFDYIYLNRPHISIKYIEFIKQNSNAKILYYGHDLHFLREQRRYEVEKDPAILKEAKKWKETETFLFDRSDIILTPSEEEKKIIAALSPNYNVHVIRPFIYNSLNEPVLNFSKRRDLLFVGGFGHKPNVDGVLWFAKEVWPSIKKEIPEAKFIIIGSNPIEQIKELNSPEILVKGFVSDEELERAYQEARMVVVPLRYGAGVKGKLVEAMHFGVPLVTTTDGVDGLPGDVSFIRPENEADQLAKQVVKYYQSEEALKQLSRLEVNYIKEFFYKEAVSKVLKEVLETTKNFA